MFELTETLN